MNKHVTTILTVKDKHFGGFEEKKVWTKEEDLQKYLDMQKESYKNRPYSTTAFLTVYDENDNFIGFEQYC